MLIRFPTTILMGPTTRLSPLDRRREVGFFWKQDFFLAKELGGNRKRQRVVELF